jgi:asparagine synthase (glutamine-hydrolysing)
LFAVLFNSDGGPVDSRAAIATAIAGGHDVEILGGRRHVAFVSSKADSSPAAAEASGIQSLGGRTWIVGRFRLDGRGDLRARLSDRLGGRPADVSDALLCLHAHAAWGDGFVDRLAGDFCFALWDGDRNRLICVRDQLGVRPLFHARTGGMQLVGDQLDWIVSQAPVARDLDDTWIADFLSIGHGLEFERTVYRHVKRLAPAHVLTISDAGATLRRYWRLEIAEPLYFDDRRVYGERFLELMALSMADRLPPGRVGVSMSGGLDSTTLAASAVRATGDPSRVVAECSHFEAFEEDQEKHFSSLAARHLGIELRLVATDGLAYDPQWRQRSTRTAEPTAAVITTHFDRALIHQRAGRAGVWLYGEGPDNALAFERNAYLSWLAGRRDWRRLGEAVLLYFGAKGSTGWLETFGRYVGRHRAPDDSLTVPPWLDRAFVGRVGLEERLRGIGSEPTPRHPWHPRAMASFNDPIWPSLFDELNHEESLGPIVWRHPFLDLRVLQFMLSLPPVPWARRKLLLREAMRGRLPDEVLARTKTAAWGSTIAQPIRTHGLPALSRGGRLSAYVDVQALPLGSPAESDLDRVVAIHALDYWLERGAP